jgi:hypothetical protein
MGAQTVAIEDGVVQSGILLAERLQYFVDGSASHLNFVFSYMATQSAKELYPGHVTSLHAGTFIYAF